MEVEEKGDGSKVQASAIIQNTFDEISEDCGFRFKGWRQKGWVKVEIAFAAPRDGESRGQFQRYNDGLPTSGGSHLTCRHCANCGSELIFSPHVLRYLAFKRPNQKFFCGRKCHSGEYAPRAKITRAIAVEVKKMLLNKMRHTEIAEHVQRAHGIKISSGAIGDIWQGKTYRNVQPLLPPHNGGLAIGERSGRAVLTADLARQIVAWDEQGKSQAWIIRKLHLGAGTVYAVRHGITWSHATGKRKEAV